MRLNFAPFGTDSANDESTLTFHKITPGEGAGARFEQLDLHSGSMLICPVDVSGARPGQLRCDATYRVPRRAFDSPFLCRPAQAPGLVSGVPGLGYAPTGCRASKPC